MPPVNSEFIERYQLELEKNPQSKVFAPLAEAYRKMGLLDEAYRICSRGVHLHPDFVSGRVAFAKILIEKKTYEPALTQLEKVVQTSPDNILAHALMGESLMELRRPKDALKSYKMVLFLNPNDEKALAVVRKWEFLTADEYEAALFAIQDPKPMQAKSPEPAAPSDEAAVREIERALSLADAYLVRNDLEHAVKVLKDAKARLGPVKEINHRLGLLARRVKVFDDELAEESTKSVAPETPEQQLLQNILQRINERRLR